MGKLAADDWDHENHETPTEESNLASVIDIAQYRSVRPEQVQRYYPTAADFDVTPSEIEYLENLRANRITEHDLKPSYRPPGAGGSGDKGPKKEAPRLTPQQRMDKFVASENFRHGSFLPETEMQRAERQLAQAAKKAERDAKRKGRPRKGDEVRVNMQTRVAPETAEWLRGNGIIPGDVLDRIVANLRKEIASELLTGPDGHDSIAA